MTVADYSCTEYVTTYHNNYFNYLTNNCNVKDTNEGRCIEKYLQK